jgi:aldose 1-epimerase
MEIKKFTLKNAKGMTVDIINYGAIVTQIMVPDRDGTLANVVLGFEDLSHYPKSNPSYFGAIVGRFANRIGGAKFELEGKTYKLPKNDGENALHGGLKGFDKVFWQVEEIHTGLKFSYQSTDMEEGYPGNLKVSVTYSLNDQNELGITYKATTDKTTPVNLTHHSYFNLSGVDGSTILDHELMIDADTYTVTDQSCIPTGEIRRLEKELDFRKFRRVGESVDQIQDGYNHNYILNHKSKVVAILKDPKSGRSMEVMTTEPGLQLYTGYFLETPFTGLCLEAQHFADSPNKKEFPSTILHPGEIYRQTTTYRFKA